MRWCHAPEILERRLSPSGLATVSVVAEVYVVNTQITDPPTTNPPSNPGDGPAPPPGDGNPPTGLPPIPNESPNPSSY
jgi:hypothetical protein